MIGEQKAKTPAPPSAKRPFLGMCQKNGRMHALRAHPLAFLLLVSECAATHPNVIPRWLFRAESALRYIPNLPLRAAGLFRCQSACR